MQIRDCLIAAVLSLLYMFFCVNYAYAANWPITNSPNANQTDQITSDYGPRITSSGASFHYGVDIRARTPFCLSP